MSGTSRPRPSQHTALPEGVTDALLWRLALDVADAHQPDEAGHCINLQCPDQAGPCAPATAAWRAMRLARPGNAPAGRSGTTDQERADDERYFGGWFTDPPPRRNRSAPRRRSPRSARAA